MSTEQQINVLEVTLKKSKFTKNTAAFIIFEEIMKNSPDKRNVHAWTDYVSDEIERVSELLHTDLAVLASEADKEQLEQACNILSNKIQSISNKVVHTSRRDTPKSYEKVLVKRQIIIVEKRDGAKLSFHFNCK